MANVIKLKQSSVLAKAPLSADLEIGELAINTIDEKLYTKNSSGAIIDLGLTTAIEASRLLESVKAATNLIKTQRIITRRLTV